MGHSTSRPAACMRGPPMPSKRTCGRRPLRARIRCAPSTSPDASPATMPIVISAAVTIVALADDAAAGSAQKIDERSDGGTFAHLALERVLRLLQAQPGPVERLVGPLQAGDRVGVEAAPLQPFGVDAVRPGRVARDGQVRRNVL